MKFILLKQNLTVFWVIQTMLQYLDLQVNLYEPTEPRRSVHQGCLRLCGQWHARWAVFVPAITTGMTAANHRHDCCMDYCTEFCHYAIQTFPCLIPCPFSL